jgi:hypothetical protein
MHDNKEIQKILDEKLSTLNNLDFQRFKIINLDRNRTNYDTNWQREYFYGDLKHKASIDCEWYINKIIDMDIPYFVTDTKIACYLVGVTEDKLEEYFTKY